MLLMSPLPALVLPSDGEHLGRVPLQIPLARARALVQLQAPIEVPERGAAGEVEGFLVQMSTPIACDARSGLHGWRGGRDKIPMVVFYSGCAE